MFVQITVVTFVAVIIGMILHFFAKPVSGVSRGPLGFIQLKTRAFMMLIPKQGTSLIGILKRLALAVGTLCFAILLLTGFLPLLLGHHLTGYWLMLHASCAPVFIVCVAFLGLTWAHANAFVTENGKVILKLLGIDSESGSKREDDFGLVSKCCFWALLVLSLPLTLSIILSMFPLFGTDGQYALFYLHRYTALAFSLITFIYAYGLMRYTAKQRGV
jgi:hypothetical protein